MALFNVFRNRGRNVFQENNRKIDERIKKEKEKNSTLENIKQNIIKYYAIRKTDFIQNKFAYVRFQDFLLGKAKYDSVIVAKYRELYETLVKDLLNNGRPIEIFDKNTPIYNILRKMSYMNSPYTYIYNFLREIGNSNGDLSKIKKIYENKNIIRRIKESEESLHDIAFMLSNVK